MRRKTRIAAVLAGLTVLAAVAAAVAAEATSDVPGHATFAARKAGDVAQYHLTVLDRNGGVESDALAFRFSWLAPQGLRDSEGRTRTANPLVLEQQAGQGLRAGTMTYFIDPADPARDFARVEQLGKTTDTVLVPVPGAASSTATSEMERVSYTRVGSGALTLKPCAAVLWPEGQRLDLDDDVRLFQHCHGPDDWISEPRFRAVRTERLGGHDAIVFEGLSAPDPLFGKLASWPNGLWVWVDPDLPYPLQIAEQEEDGRTYVHRLTGLARGTGGPLATSSAPSEPLPTVELAPRQPWGMDDRGVDHPWPLSAAWTHARDDPLAPRMRDWLAAHPDAYTARVFGRTMFYGETERQIEWKWVLTDGRDQITVGHSRLDAKMPALPGPLPLDLGMPPMTTVRYSYDNSSIGAEPAVFPRLDQLEHDQLPTVTSLQRHWRAYSGDERPLDQWSFADPCYNNTCDRQPARRSIGTYRWTGEMVGGSVLHAVSGWDLDYDSLEYSLPLGPEVGPFLEVRRIRSDAVDLTVAGMALEDKPATPPQGLAVVAGAWQPTGPVGIAAVGLLAAIVFVVARFGGALLGLRLFSRIQGPDLLDHPLRRSLHEAIESQPGIHLKALARTVGRPRNTVEHHVRKLVTGGLVTQHELNGYACLFLKGQVDRREQAAAGALKSDAARKVLAAVLRVPGASGRDVAAQAGLTPTLVSYHVGNLQKAGLVEGQRQGREVRLVPTELGRKAAA